MHGSLSSWSVVVPDTIHLEATTDGHYSGSPIPRMCVWMITLVLIKMVNSQQYTHASIGSDSQQIP